MINNSSFVGGSLRTTSRNEKVMDKVGKIGNEEIYYYEKEHRIPLFCKEQYFAGNGDLAIPILDVTMVSVEMLELILEDLKKRRTI